MLMKAKFVISNSIKIEIKLHERFSNGFSHISSDLFYEQKNLFGEKRHLDNSINRICCWLGMDPTSGYLVIKK